MPQPGATVQETANPQEVDFRHLLSMTALPPNLWSIQGKQLDPWLLHRAVVNSGGLQLVCAHPVGSLGTFSLYAYL
jgi:hypothetical protein